MKKTVLFTILGVLASFQMSGRELEISFNYEKQPGPGSNQYAVWIEDAGGKVVKTLFVTSFTSKGRSRDGQKAERGYRFRPACVPNWVKAVDADSLSDGQMDAFTGATPASSGTQTFVWDFTDQNGKAVARGKYVFHVEATYFNEGQVLYTGEVMSSGRKDIGVIKEVFSNPSVTEHKGMISSLTARVR